MDRVELVLPSSEKRKSLVKDGKTFRSLYDFKVTEDDLKQAYLELGETEKVRIASLEELKKKLMDDGDVLYNTSDDFLLRYLRFSKFQVEKAHSMLRNLGKLRTDHPEIFDLPSDLETLLSKNFIAYLPYRDEEGSVVIWADFRKWNIEEIPPIGFLKIENACGDLYTMNPAFQISSLVAIFDLRGCTSAHLAAFLRPSTLRLVLNVIQIVFLGSDLKELHQYLNPILYPKEYGGTIEWHESNMKDFFLENIPYMKYQRSFKLLR